MTRVVPESESAPGRDWELLRQYVEHGRDDAFADLASSYAPLVYSAALRQTADADLAEEVSQTVFILLARKAPELRPGVVLAAWLYRAARYTALNVRKAEVRRQRHERMAARMNPESGGDLRHADTSWHHLAGLLDEGVSRLRERDRQAVLLRFFQRRSLDEVGSALGVSADAAQMRVSRALEKLRAFFRQRGVRLPAGALGNVLLVNAVRAAPPRLLRSIRCCTARAMTGSAAAGRASEMAAEVARAMARARARRIAAVVLSGAATCVVTLLLIHAAITRPPRRESPETPRPQEPQRDARAAMG